ncbi:MAG: nucleoside phosphorylase [Flavobacteriales bacterium]|nr:nucleoside phosphorylase [Flavobacteriales bacterium]MDG1934744.1 nucleoside phosphorylase [Flavobacteriales bacterium]
MNAIAETELIITKDKKIYHLNLSENEIADNIILVGDQDRVKLISSKFDFIEHKIQNREFITHTGVLNNTRISAISTGIGTDNIDIVVNELDALVNIDFETRTHRKNRKSLNLIRLGTSGALQSNIDIDSFITSAYGLGLDNLAHFYNDQDIIDLNMSKLFSEHAKWPKELSSPYIVKASEDLLKLFSEFNTGITATAPGFYGPQGRKIRLSPSISDLNNTISSFSFNEFKVTNFEMETSALYFLGRSLGHNTLTICAIIGNRFNKSYSKDHRKPIAELIEIVLEKICTI